MTFYSNFSYAHAVQHTTDGTWLTNHFWKKNFNILNWLPSECVTSVSNMDNLKNEKQLFVRNLSYQTTGEVSSSDLQLNEFF